MLSKEKFDRLFKTAESAFANQSRRLDGFISEESSKQLEEISKVVADGIQDAQTAIDLGKDILFKSRFK
jgi:hypothetical protein